MNAHELCASVDQNLEVAETSVDTSLAHAECKSQIMTRLVHLRVAGVVAVVLFLSACAGHVPLAGTTATLTAEQAVDWPPRLFDGDCSLVLTSSDAESVFGAKVVQYPGPDVTVYPRESTIALAGGVDCYWIAGNAEPGVGGTVRAVPADGVVKPSERMWCEYGTCQREFISSNIFFVILIGLGDPDKLADEADYEKATKRADKRLDAFRTIVEKRAVDWANFAPAKHAEGSWTTSEVDCSALGIAAGIDSTSGEITVNKSVDEGTQEGQASTYRIAVAQVKNTSCTWSRDDQPFVTIVLLGGQGFSEPAIAELKSAHRVDIPGADLAYTYVDDDGVKALSVARGPNRLDVNLTEVPDIGNKIKDVLDLLDGKLK